MQVHDQVKVKGAGEYQGRAGMVTKVTGKDEKMVVTVNLDETPTHESGEVDFPIADLEFLGR